MFNSSHHHSFYLAQCDAFLLFLCHSEHDPKLKATGASALASMISALNPINMQNQNTSISQNQNTSTSQNAADEVTSTYKSRALTSPAEHKRAKNTEMHVDFLGREQDIISFQRRVRNAVN